MFRIKFISSLLIILCFTLIFQTDLSANDKDKAIKQSNLSNELFANPFLNFNNFDYQPTLSIFQESETVPGLKSPKKGMLFSLLIPGSGEMYSKSWIKGALFLGIEIGGWVAYSKYHKEGKDLEYEYIAYAEENWSENRWNIWWNSLSEANRSVYAHHELPETKTQQYYEMIGKYQKYNAGWDDINPANALSDTSQHSLYYMDLRGDSNDKLKLATTFTAIVLANHIFSSLDAVLSVNRYNKKLRSSLGMDYVMIDNRPRLVTKLTVNW